MAIAGSRQGIICIILICSFDGEYCLDVGEVLVANLEVERCDVHGDGNISIVGIHIGQMILLLCILMCLGA